ncbi:unnamed protein product [Brachionus calyciflorus]|uniref:Uncharacterized protein n=1 Tax=Brachionus calyciflorus TaxID=104777 RepID=A0A813NGZ9_9BILA|nr:unnamed protein product [Brachionus calyciflorus]
MNKFGIILVVLVIASVLLQNEAREIKKGNTRPAHTGADHPHHSGSHASGAPHEHQSRHSIQQREAEDLQEPVRQKVIQKNHKPTIHRPSTPAL